MISSMTSARERIGSLDIAIAVLASAGAGIYMAAELGSRYDVNVFGVVLFVGIGVALLWRRAAPLAAITAVLAIVLLHAALFPDGVRCGVGILVTLLLAYAAGAWLDRPETFVGLGLVLGIVVALCGLDGPEGAPLEASLFVGPIAAGVWAIGRIVHSRGRLVSRLRSRTAELREARDERARLEVAGERARLSGELSGLLQRRLGELARLADAGGSLGDRAQTSAALAEIERESRRTLEEMRAVVGLLRDDSAEVPTAPQPTLTHLDALLVRAKGGGARLAVDGSPRVLPAAVELSAYRIVEQLLAALEDAPGVEVRVRFGDDALELAVVGPARRRARASIERASERARLARGTLEATVRGGRAEAVASLPLVSVA